MIAAAGPTALWYAARSTGYVSLLLLTAILALGITTSMRWSSREWPRFVSQALHRNLSLVVLVFLLIHIVTSVADPFAGISMLNATAPFTGSYRPLWLGLGVVSVELLAAVTVTSLLRQRIGFVAWRVIHWAAYACWPLAVLHTLGTGSDVRSVWAVLLSIACLGVVVAAIVWRLLGDPQRVPAAVRLGGLALTLAATISVLGFASMGPLRSGWAKSAGTPDQLLAVSAGQAASATAPAAITLPAGVTDQVSGTLLNSATGVFVQLADSRDPLLRITISVTPSSSEGQITLTEGTAQFCVARAAISQDVVATCGSTDLDIALTSQPGGGVSGQMVTRAAS